jgi:DNA (cytosine-5)-methyltransferase 1
MDCLQALDFFAGSGLVRVGLEPDFTTVWANDNCARKAAVYDANGSGRTLCLASIHDVAGADLPAADLAWASFPCQDLSLAGNLTGLRRGTRSGLFWEWMRVLDEMAAATRKPPLVVAENVVGFLVANEGDHFERAYHALKDRGYLAGALVVDARHFVPQSRPRAFLIGISRDIEIRDFAQPGPSAPFHPDVLIKAAGIVGDPEWVWWSLPAPAARASTFADLCEIGAPRESAEKTARLRAMLSPRNRRKLERAIASREPLVGTGYRRTRSDSRGRKIQRLELRFDGVAGCLRTPEGGSSRQIVMLVNNGRVRSRLMTVRECARLMGAPDTFVVPGSYNDGYRAMGDAVAVPVVRWLTQHLLAPLAARARTARTAGASAA